jgi:HAD superfamily hydrolase (TIGR01509 family)
MIKAWLFDLSRTILFPKDKAYLGELNKLHKDLLPKPNYDFSAHFQLDEDLLGFLATQKDKYKLYIFTSGSIQEASQIKSRLLEVFDDVFSAETIGLTKKDPESYRKISDMLGLTPDEVIFVDDSQENVSAAKTAGMNGVVYREFEELKKEIGKYLG